MDTAYLITLFGIVILVHISLHEGYHYAASTFRQTDMH